MSKVSLAPTNDYCPQTLFLYGTYLEDGTPNFGLFCWFSYYWDGDLGVMACIGGSKLTLDRIREKKVFSANLVTEKLLPFADYCGTKFGRDGGKMDVSFAWERGATLDVPVLTDSPVCFELEVDRFISFKEDSEVLLCKVRNVLMDEWLTDDSLSPEEKLTAVAPASTTCMTYFTWDGKKVAKWHELSAEFAEKK